MIALAHKKKELEGEYEAVNERIAEHEAAHESKLAAVEGAFDLAAYEAAVAEAHAQYDATIERIAKDRELAVEGKADFEASIADKVREAAEARDNKDAEIAQLETDAAQEKEQAFIDIEAGKVAAAEAHADKVQAVRDEVAAQAAEDEAKYDSVAEEIKVIATRLLELNEKFQEKLTALTNL